MARHLEQIHSGEDEVKKAIAYDPKDPKRVQQFEKLCRMGNFNHNMKVLDIKGLLQILKQIQMITYPASIAMAFS